MSKPLASDFAQYANQRKWIGIPYEQWDCQKYVEQMLKGVGAFHDWRGSNDMWRNALSNKGTIAEMKQRQGGQLKPGTWLFTIKHDGKEDKSRYKDGVNAAHVGIYIGGGRVMHSTTGGVQADVIDSKRWTHAGECKLLDYGTANNDKSDMDKVKQAYNLLGEVIK